MQTIEDEIDALVLKKGKVLDNWQTRVHDFINNEF